MILQKFVVSGFEVVGIKSNGKGAGKDSASVSEAVFNVNL